MSRVTIELGRENKNIDVYVEPLGMTLMGKFSNGNIPRGTVSGDDSVFQCPPLPGWRIILDAKARSVTIFHPFYKTREGERADKLFRQAYGKGFDASVPPQIHNDGKLIDLEDDSMQEWFKWAYRVTHDRDGQDLASIVDGEFPKGTKESVEYDREFQLCLRETQRRNAEKLAREEMQARSNRALNVPAK